MLKQINKGINQFDSRSKWCITCDTKDTCNSCDAADWGCNYGYEICIFRDSDG